MAKKQQAPKGKGERKKVRARHRKPVVDIRKSQKAKALISIESALTFLQSQGVEVTEKTIDDLAELGKIRATYIGKGTNDSNDIRKLKTLMVQALEKCLGLVTYAAKIVGIHRATHYEWMKKDQEYADCVDSLSDVALDFGEDHLFQLIKEKNPAAVIFYLKTRGKKRGYIETVHNMNQSFNDDNVVVMIPHNDRDDIEDAKVIG